MASTSQLPLCKHRYFLFVSYLGTKYRGSQRQTSRVGEGVQDTVQEALEWSLAHLLPQKMARVTASSRTDSGVHALMNCYSLPLMQYDHPTERIKRVANEHLSRKLHDIVVNEVMLVPAESHPRKQAISREYIYRLAVFNNLNEENPRRHAPSDILNALPITELYRALPLPRFDKDEALEALDILRGEHDFASFASKPLKDEDTVRNLEVNLTQETPATVDKNRQYPFTIYNLHFKSRAFLYNQVRRMVGAIITYASYRRIKLQTIKSLLDNPSKRWLGSILIAEPYGLYLSRINFDKSTFEGAYKTYEDNREERVLFYPPPSDRSDDQEEKTETPFSGEYYDKRSISL